MQAEVLHDQTLFLAHLDETFFEHRIFDEHSILFDAFRFCCNDSHLNSETHPIASERQSFVVSCASSVEPGRVGRVLEPGRI